MVIQSKGVNEGDVIYLHNGLRRDFESGAYVVERLVKHAESTGMSRGDIFPAYTEVIARKLQGLTYDPAGRLFTFVQYSWLTTAVNQPIEVWGEMERTWKLTKWFPEYTIEENHADKL
jgi:hypothetical protein